MNVDSTIRPGQQSGDVQALQREELTRNVEAGHLTAGQMNMNRAEGVACPTCGTVNDPDALFCASCGKPLRMGTCPNCGTEIDLDADYCETCHHYIRQDVCSFCGAKIAVGEIYCHECGSPRGGIVCPVCNTLNSFAFCKQCGTPLTEEARMLMSELQRLPDYQLLSKTARELETLDMEVPYNSERDVVRDQMNDKLRERVLLLLAKDKGVPNPVIPKKVTKKLSKEELERRKEDKKRMLTEALERLAVPALPSPVKARNYAMAQKPAGVKLAWVCNWKHAMHSSPCGCAKPQLGGKWVILGKNTIKDDNV